MSFSLDKNQENEEQHVVNTCQGYIQSGRFRGAEQVAIQEHLVLHAFAVFRGLWQG